MTPQRVSCHRFLLHGLLPLIILSCISVLYMHKLLPVTQDDDMLPSIDSIDPPIIKGHTIRRSSTAQIRLPSPCNKEAQNPSVSFVFAGRNDNYVGIYKRARISLAVLLNQLHSILRTTTTTTVTTTSTEDYDYASAEILIVSWGHDPNRPSLYEEVVVPAVELLEYDDNGSNNTLEGLRLDRICVRVIEVPSELTDPTFSFSEFVAKNVAIRRARGDIIITSNLDNFFSPTLVRMALGVDSTGARRPLNDTWFVRAMRFNIDLDQGSVWWKGTHYRASSLKAPANSHSVLDWMSDNNNGVDSISMMEKDFERQSINYISQYSRFDELCSEMTESNHTEELFHGLEVRDYSKAAGDFTLAPASAWYKLSGYPEVFKNNHLDGAQLCRFIQAGYRQVVLRPSRPCSAMVFHQRHESGREDRVEQGLGPLVGCADEQYIENRFAAFVNKVDWGWGNSHVFEEDVLTFVRDADNSVFHNKSCHVVGEEANCSVTTMKSYQNPSTKQRQESATDAERYAARTKLPTKNVISFSLYGKGTRYTDGAIANAKLALEIYPGWQVYIYHDNSVPQAVLTKLSSIPHVSLFNVSVSLAKTNSMAWRFMVALDPEISVYIIRDIDSRLNYREKAAVTEWLIGSNASFHVMHDHPGHCGMPIQGGMWGGRVVLPEIEHVIHPKSTDQDLMAFWGDCKMLRDTIWPIIKEDVIHHDSYCCGKFNETIPSRPFPTPRANGTGEHVGSVYLPSLGGELRDGDKLKVLKQKECQT